MIAAPYIEVIAGGAARVSRTLRSPCTVRVGSSSACDLRVVARGVRARHLALEWDGERLVIVDAEGTGPVRVDGRAVRPPFAIFGSARVQIGAAEVHAVAPMLQQQEDAPTLVMPGRDDTEVLLVPAGPPPLPSVGSARGSSAVTALNDTERLDEPTEVTAEVTVDMPAPFDALTIPQVTARKGTGGIGAARLASRLRRFAPICRVKALLATDARATVGLVLAVIFLAAVLGFARHRRAHPAAPHSSNAASGAAAPSSSFSSAISAPFLSVAAPPASAPSPAAAASLLASGRRDEATDAYTALARARPSEPVFGVVAQVLMRERRERAETSGGLRGAAR